jgi:hypothetical protein
VDAADEFVVTLNIPTNKNPDVPADNCSPPCPTGSLCCRSPNVTVGTCFNVATCSQIHDGATIQPVVVGVNLAAKADVAWRKNTSNCWALAAASPGKLLCVEDEPCPKPHPTGCANNYLHNLDIATGEETTIGAFPHGLTGAVFLATFDTKTGTCACASNASRGYLPRAAPSHWSATDTAF